MSSFTDFLPVAGIGGSGTANYIPKFIDTNTIGNSAIYESSGNIGIGTTSAAGSSGYTNLALNNTTGSEISLRAADSTKGYLYANAGIMVVDGTVGTLAFQTSSVERMRIDSSGNVGIGTSSPTYKLEVQGTNPVFRLKGGAGFGFLVDQNSTTGDVSQILYEASNLRFGTNSAERMRITSDGRINMLSVGDTSLNIQSNRNVSGDVNIYSQMGGNTNNTSSFYFVGQNTSAGNRILIYGNGNVVNANNSYGAISDIKVKENITDTTSKLDDILQVKVRNFNYIGDDKKQIGVVAQELEEVFPSMIDESPDFEEQEVTDEEGNVTIERVDLGTTTKSVKYSVFVPMLIKAMQEQQEIIEGLKARIETLENK